MKVTFRNGIVFGDSSYVVAEKETALLKSSERSHKKTLEAVIEYLGVKNNNLIYTFDEDKLVSVEYFWNELARGNINAAHEIQMERYTNIANAITEKYLTDSKEKIDEYGHNILIWEFEQDGGYVRIKLRCSKYDHRSLLMSSSSYGSQVALEYFFEPYEKINESKEKQKAANKKLYEEL